MPIYLLDYARNLVGWGQVPVEDPGPPPVVVTTKYGYNVDAPQAPLSSRLTKWGNRAPLVRSYAGPQFLPSPTFNFTTGTHPERGLVYSWKADSSGPYTASGLALGNGNSRIKDWAESIPGGATPWDVKVGFWHEMNSGTGPEVDPTTYLNIYNQMRTAIDSAVLQPGVKLTLWCNFMAYQIGDGTGTGFKDVWVPDPSVCHGISWDVYLNPGNFTSGTSISPNCPSALGPEYCAGFPNTATRHRDWMRATVRNGYGADGRWAIWEYNGPPRDWDGPVNPDYACGTNKRLRYQGGRTATGHDASHTEVERAAALVAGLEYFQSRPSFTEGALGVPDHVLFWEHLTGVNWNQHFYHDNVWNALKPYFVNSP